MSIIRRHAGVLRGRALVLTVALLPSGYLLLHRFGPGDRPAGSRSAAIAGWTAVWRDDFTGPAGRSVATSRWRYDTGTHYPGGPSGWGNNELETYTTSTNNVYLDGKGHLAIRPIRNIRGGWTSGRLETRRTNFQPSKDASLAFSARIKLPAGGQGYWPAFWMLGAPFRANVHSWPAAGELDVMENVNSQPTIRGTLHCGRVQMGGPCNEPVGQSATYNLGRPAGVAGFHTYTIIWNTSPEQIRWYVDRKPYLTVTSASIGSSTWRSTFDHGFFVLLNVAIGGNLPRNPNSRTRSGAPMLVDDVTVSRNPNGGAGPPPQ